jgi:ribosome-binding protein aMBF1 (putative translation factor)
VGGGEGPRRGDGARAPFSSSLPRNVTLSLYTESLQPSNLGVIGRERATPDVRERFGLAVRTRREAPGMTQEDLVGRVGIHRTYLSDGERGSRNLGLLNIERLSAVECHF